MVNPASQLWFKTKLSIPSFSSLAQDPRGHPWLVFWVLMVCSWIRPTLRFVTKSQRAQGYHDQQCAGNSEHPSRTYHQHGGSRSVILRVRIGRWWSDRLVQNVFEISVCTMSLKSWDPREKTICSIRGGVTVWQARSMPAFIRGGMIREER